eukprot:Rhum_TRINITY_DN14489_c1_g2::Rhum_TRINITY_DN14489_c1_g2_i1::g.92261::m.92261/K14440/SMARCAL1, HARP; SWI/SNF-related matrix-associated actin-dependent regulator of chromatin subfamily A-like protein 1
MQPFPAHPAMTAGTDAGTATPDTNAAALFARPHTAPSPVPCAVPVPVGPLRPPKAATARRNFRGVAAPAEAPPLQEGQRLPCPAAPLPAGPQPFFGSVAPRHGAADAGSRQAQLPSAQPTPVPFVQKAPTAPPQTPVPYVQNVPPAQPSPAPAPFVSSAVAAHVQAPKGGVQPFVPSPQQQQPHIGVPGPSQPFSGGKSSSGIHACVPAGQSQEPPRLDGGHGARPPAVAAAPTNRVLPFVPQQPQQPHTAHGPPTPQPFLSGAQPQQQPRAQQPLYPAKPVPFRPGDTAPVQPPPSAPARPGTAPQPAAPGGFRPADGASYGARTSGPAPSEGLQSLYSKSMGQAAPWTPPPPPPQQQQQQPLQQQSLQNVLGIKCLCGTEAAKRVARNSDRGNVGKLFYACKKPKGESCKYFKWAPIAEAEAKGITGSNLLYSEKAVSNLRMGTTRTTAEKLPVDIQLVGWGDVIPEVGVAGPALQITFPAQGAEDVVSALTQTHGVAPLHVDTEQALRIYKLSDYQTILSVLKKFPHVDLMVPPPTVFSTVTQEMNRIRPTVAWDTCSIPKTLQQKLLPFQREGIEYAVSRGGRCLVGDEMGLGKTIQAIALLSYYQEWPALVIVPSNLKFMWYQTVLQELPYLSSEHVQVVPTSKSTVDGMINIISFDIAVLMHKQLLEREQRFGIVVMDEAHSIKSDKTKRYNNLRSLCMNTDRLVLLSGTPALNRPIELFTQVEILLPGQTHTNVLCHKKSFQKRYCDLKANTFGAGMDDKGHSNLQELQYLLRLQCMIRREKNKVLHELPEKRRTEVHIQVSDAELGQMDKHLMKMKDRFQSLDDVSLMDESASKPALPSRGKAPHSLLHMFTATSKAKQRPVCEYIEQKYSHGEKVLIFAHHLDMLNALEVCVRGIVHAHNQDPSLVRRDGVWDHIRIDGGTSAKQDLCDHFQNTPTCKFAVLSIKACGVGLTLHSSSTVLFAELYWTPGEMVQAEDRVHRIGQKDECNIIYLLAQGTSDDLLWPLLSRKLSVLGATLNSRQIDDDNTGKWSLEKKEFRRAGAAGGTEVPATHDFLAKREMSTAAAKKPKGAQQQQQQQQVVEAAATSATSAAAEPAQPSKPAAPSQAAAPAKKKAAAKPAALVPAAAAASPRAYVEELLQQEFGEGVELDAVGRQLLETNLSRLGRAIVRLASDLYSSDVHFVLELIQNADDNTYPATRAGAEVVPTLRLDVTGDAVVVSNNEVGFRPENIRALCDVGSSTKMGAEGYIGMKGIGFKSVFRVTASPEIHSSGFHIAFNVAAEAEGGKGSMGYISPTWLGDDGEQGHPDRSVVARKSGDDGGADGGYATQIVLPLLPDLRGSEGRSELIEKMEDVQPSLLLFLRKVRNLVVRDHVRGTVLDMVRRDLGRIAPSAEQAAAASTASSSSSSHADIVEVSVNKQPFKWLVKRGGYSTRGEVVRQDLRGDVATTELALAFPLDAPSSGGGDEREDMMVFAFLPLRTCGLKFVLQGDWAIPTSREDIDAGSPWNQWLRAKIPGLFVSALDNFKACHAPEAQPAALSTFLTFVPEGAGVIPFFRPLVQGVRALLLGTPCMLTSAGGWALPSDVVVLPDTLAAPPCSLASVLAPEATLRAALDKVYLHPGVELSEKMARHLRVGRIGVAELVTLLEHKLGARDEDDDDGVSYRAWLRCWIHSVTACLDGRCGTPSSAAATPALFERLKRLRFVPLEGGGVGSVRDGAIFSAASAAAGAGAAGKTRAAEKEEEEAAPSPASASVLDPQDARYRPLTKGMRMLDAGMLEGAEPAVAAFFVSLGVRRLTPLDVVERFLLPRYRELSAAREGGGGLVAVAAAGAAGEGQVWEGAHGAAGTRVSVTAAFLHATVWFLAAHRGVLPDDARRKIAKVVLLHTNAGPVSPRETAVLFSSAYQAERRAGAAGAADGDSDSSSDDGAQHMEVDEDEPRTAYGPDRFHLRYTFSRAEGGTVSLRDRAKESGALSEKTTSEASARNPAGFVVVSDGYLGASAAVAAAAAAAGEEGEARKRRRGESAWELADALVSLGVEWFYAPTVKRVWVSDYTKTSLWRDCAWPLASRSGEVLDRQCAPLEAALTKLVACFDQLGKKEKEKGEAKVRRGESFARMGEILSCLLCVAEEVNNAPHAAAAAQSDFVSSSDKKKKKQGGAAGLFATLGGNSAAAAGAKLPSSYTHMLRTLRWLPSSRYTLNTPPELLQRTPAATRLLGSAALHPLLPVLSDRRVAEAAALRTEVSAGDVVEALERQGTAAVSAGAAYGRSGYPASLSTMAAMYSFLREQHAAGSIAPECLATLRGGPVLFVPRTAARVNEVTGDTLGMFCRPSEVAWEDPVAELARPAAAGGGAKLYSVDADKGLLGELEGVLASDRDGAAGGGGAAAACCAVAVGSQHPL